MCQCKGMVEKDLLPTASQSERVGRGSGDGNFCFSLLPPAMTLKLGHLNKDQ